MKIYLASSWNNNRHTEVLNKLREKHTVYDYRTDGSFGWWEIDSRYEKWTTKEFVYALQHPLAKKAFKTDYKNMIDADCCIALLPSGRSTHMEMGFMSSQGKPLYILTQDGEKAELTYSLATLITNDLEDILERLEK